MIRFTIAAIILFMFLPESYSKEKKFIFKHGIKKSGLVVQVIHKRMNLKSTLIKFAKGSFRIKSDLGSFNFFKKTDNLTEVCLDSYNDSYNSTIKKMMNQTIHPEVLLSITRRMEQKSYINMFTLHLISPALSYLYIDYENPFIDRSDLWFRVIMHVGIDLLGYSAISTKGFTQKHKFNITSVLFLFLHRIVFLPDFMFETDIYNKTARAGYRFKF